MTSQLLEARERLEAIIKLVEDMKEYLDYQIGYYYRSPKIRIYQSDYGDLQMRDGETEEEAKDRARAIWELGGYLRK
jgi:hypothetical protein